MIISVCYCENDIKVGSEYHNNIPVITCSKSQYYSVIMLEGIISV